jgi:hypothetical protein
LNTSATYLEIWIASHLGIRFLFDEESLRGKVSQFIRSLKSLFFDYIVSELLQSPIDVDLIPIECGFVGIHIHNDGSYVLSAVNINSLIIIL